MQRCQSPLAAVTATLLKLTGVSLCTLLDPTGITQCNTALANWHQPVPRCSSPLTSCLRFTHTSRVTHEHVHTMHWQHKGSLHTATGRAPHATPRTHGFSRFRIAPLLAPLKPDRCAISLWKGAKKCASSRRGKMRIPAHHKHTFLHAVKQCLANPKGAHLGRKACCKHPCMHPNYSIGG